MLEDLVRRADAWRDTERMPPPKTFTTVTVRSAMSFELTSAAALNDRAIALFEGGDGDGADAAWYQALALDPDHFEATFNRMLAAWRRGHATDRDVIASVEGRHAARDGAWPTVYALGLVHLERRDLARAVPLLDDAVRRSRQALGFEPLLGQVRETGGVERVAEFAIDRPPSSPLPIVLAGDASVVLVGEGHEVVLRRPQDLSVLARLSGHTGSVTVLAMTPDGRVGVSGGDDARLSVWDLSSRHLRRGLDAPDLGPVRGVGLSADGRRAVTVSLDPVYAEATRQQADAIRQWHEENRGCILPVDIKEERVVHLWDLDSGEGRVLERGANAAHLVRSSADGAHVLLMGDGERLLDFSTGAVSAIDARGVVASLVGGPSSVRPPDGVDLGAGFAAARDGRRAVWARGHVLQPNGEYDHTLVVYDTVAGRCLHTIALERAADTVQTSTDGTLVVAASSGGSIVQTWRLPERWEPLVPFQSSRPAVVVPPMASGASELRARAEDALTRGDFSGALEALSALRQQPGHERTEESCKAWARLYRACTRTGLRSTWIVRTFKAPALVRLAHDGSAIASAGDAAPTAFTLEDTRSGRRLLNLEGAVDRPGSLDFSTNMRFLAAGGYATIAVWDLDTGRVNVHSVRHFDSIAGLRIANDGRHARFASRSGTKVWDGSETARPGTDPLSASLAQGERDRGATADGRWQFEAVLTPGPYRDRPGPVHLVDTAQGTRRVLVPGYVISAEVSRDGQWLLTVESIGAFDRVVRVRFLDWDLAAPGPDAIPLDLPRAFPGIRPTRPPRERGVVYEDRRGPHRHRLEAGEWVIGRAPDSDIVVDDFALSRRHAKLVVDDDTVHITDLKSKGGTQVNDVPVETARLAPGDHLRLGQFRMQFLDGEPPPDPDAPERRAMIDCIAAIKGRPPGSFDENTRIGALGDSFLALMYVVSAIEGEYRVKLAPDELMRINTVGELVDLVGRARGG
jgi:WD40 repeat protein